jgi:hypothetical protein
MLVEMWSGASREAALSIRKQMNLPNEPLGLYLPGRFW